MESKGVSPPCKKPSESTLTNANIKSRTSSTCTRLNFVGINAYLYEHSERSQHALNHETKILSPN